MNGLHTPMKRSENKIDGERVELEEEFKRFLEDKIERSDEVQVRRLSIEPSPKPTKLYEDESSLQTP